MKDHQRPRYFILSPFCLLRPTTNRIFDMRMCDGLAGNGADVEIVYPYVYMKENIRRSEIPGAFAVKNKFKTTMQYTWMRENSHPLHAFAMMLFAFTITAFRIALTQLFSRRPAVILSRDPKSVFPMLLLRKMTGSLLRTKVIFAAAEVTNRRLFKWVVKNSDGVFAGVTTTRDAIMKIVPLPKEKFMLSLAPVPVYENDPTKAEARKRINYNENKPLIVYTGKLGMDVNELKYILQSAAILKDYKFLFTGGRESAVESVKKYCAEIGVENAIFTGFFNDSSAVRNYQMAADILVSYYTSKDHMIEFNYPQKINEYMSTGNVVITPDTPATQDVLNKSNVFFVAPDNPQALAEGIKHLVDNPALANALSQKAREDIKALSFDSKTRELMAFAASLR